MGVIAMIVAAIPVEVFCAASSESETPMNGPKVAPSSMRSIGFFWGNAPKTAFHLLKKLTTTVKPSMPAITLIWVEAKGSKSPIPYLLSTYPVA